MSASLALTFFLLMNALAYQTSENEKLLAGIHTATITLHTCTMKNVFFLALHVAAVTISYITIVTFLSDAVLHYAVTTETLFV